MENTTIDLGLNFALIVALVIGLAQVLKKTVVSTRYIPLCTLVIGVGLSILISGINSETVVIGLAAGLASMGLFSGTKTTLEG